MSRGATRGISYDDATRSVAALRLRPADRLEAEAKAAGFLEYFEQVDVSGENISPEALNGDMIQFRA